MNTKAIIFILLLTHLITGGCARVPECPTIAPYRSTFDPKKSKPGLDLDVVRIFSNRSTAKPPSRFRFAPDGKTIALLEDSLESADIQRLWLVEVEKRRKRPLFLGKEIKIDAFEWLDSNSLVVQTPDKIQRITLNNEVFPVFENVANVRSLTPSPDGRYLGYTRKNNLFGYEIATGKETQLTFNENADICSGCVSWLYEEEFETEKGFEWSSDSRRIWFRTVDTQAVEKTTVALSDAGTFEQIPYSHPGKNNPLVTLNVVALPQTDAQQSAPLVTLPVQGDNDAYIPDAMWHPGKPAILVTRMDRLQTRFELLECTIDAETSACEKIFERTDPRWVNYPGLPRFTPDGRQYGMVLELDNFAQLFLFDSTTHQTRQLTSGNTPIQRLSTLTSDAAYFTAPLQDPLNMGIYRVAFSDGTVAPVNDTQGWHAPVFAPGNSVTPTLFVDTFSTVDQSPRVQLCDTSGAPIMRLDSDAMADYRLPGGVVNEFTTFETRGGDTLYVHITRPEVTRDQQYPVMVYTYGGPRYQAVANRYNTTFTAWRNLLATRGIVVFTVDNRGSSGRGRAFETAIHRELPGVGLADQLEAIEWLKRQPYVDSSRFGMIGWSFGGTMTLNALLQTENIFKLGVAIAPVTDWNRYDSAYTERYMQRPQDNPKGYAATDLTRRTAELGEKLLLVHGTGDRNVLPEHSDAFVTESVLNGKPLQLLQYPGEGHSIDNRKKRAHLFSEITRFIEQNL